jgi:hypothetical protein
MKQEKGLRSIPGVGKSIEQDLRAIGIDRPSCLKNENPELLYKKMCKQQGVQIDRCMLYVLRCAVYFASNKVHKPGLLLWWNWSDENIKKHPR